MNGTVLTLPSIVGRTSVGSVDTGFNRRGVTRSALEAVGTSTTSIGKVLKVHAGIPGQNQIDVFKRQLRKVTAAALQSDRIEFRL
jgi:hypothetical protein